MEPACHPVSQKNAEILRIQRYAIIAAILWTVLLSGLFLAYVVDNHQALHEIGRSMAQASFEKHLILRRWAAGHGGVYVPETAATPANPFLADVPERDIITPSGRHLTLLNPSYMSRQIFDLAREQPDIPHGHITSLKPVRPENAPDPWETKALKRFEQGVLEVTETADIDGQTYLRFMRPLLTEKPCLSCHAAQGYNVGDLRGGISITVPLKPIQKTMRSDMLQEAAIHLVIWLVGLGLIGFGTRRICRTVQLLSKERDNLRQSKESLRELNDTLQEQKEELQVNEESLRDQNEELQSIEDVLRIQNKELEVSKKMLIEREVNLQRQNGLLASLLKNIPIGVFMIEVPSGKPLLANDAASKLLGRGILPEATADNLAEVYQAFKAGSGVPYPPDQMPIVMGMNGISSHVDDMMVQRPDGTSTLLEIFGTPVSDDRGQIWASLVSFVDITERRQLEAERQQFEQQFHHAQKMESLGVLAGGIAHDFNNILTIILGHCYMAKQGMLSGNEYNDAFQQVETAGNRAADLCRQMLTYAGKTPTVKVRVNLWLLVDEDVKMLTSAINKNVTIKTDLQQDIPEITGDSGQLQQVIMNLIINAAEAIGDKNGTITVALTKMCCDADRLEADAFGTVLRAGRYVCLEVTDNGSGMEEDIQKRIFEPFYTTKFTGRGLGMSAIHGIIRSHQALLFLNSTPGSGTTFKVCFPLLDIPTYPENIESSAVRSERPGGMVLLVDDECSLRDMGTNLLEALGYSVCTAEHGREAVEIYHQRGSEIDVVLLDLVMPVMGGIEAYQELRKINPNLPIVICSGYGVESVEDVIRNDLHAGFVHKPYKPGGLRDSIARIMKHLPL